MLVGENVSALGRELGVRRKSLYQWRERFRLGGAIALRSSGLVRRRRGAADTAPPPSKACSHQRGFLLPETSATQDQPAFVVA